MLAKNGNVRVVLKFALAGAAVIAVAYLALNYARATALVATVARGAAVDIVTGSVVVHADGDLFELKSPLAGRVAWCEPLDPRNAGFKKGDDLLRLDSEDLKREIKQAEDDFNATVEKAKIKNEKDPALQLAKKNLENAQRLYERGDKSKEEFEAAKRGLDSVTTNLALADFDTKQAKIQFDVAQEARRRKLELMTVHAPFDGKVQAGFVRPTALIGEGAVVATIYSNARLVVAKVSEDNFSKIKVGQLAKVRLLTLGSAEFDAKVTEILPFADADTQRYTVYLEVALPSEKLVPNSTGEVTITVGEHPDQLLIPRGALFGGLDGNYVFVVNGGRVERRKVTTGFVGLNKAEVRAGLTVGELVIVGNLEDFREGQRVRVTAAE